MAAMMSSGMYMASTPITAGNSLSSSSAISPGLDVTTFRNISTEMMPCPKR